MWGCREYRVCTVSHQRRGPAALPGGGLWIAESLGHVHIRKIKTEKETLVAGAFSTVIVVVESLHITVSLAQMFPWTETDP